MSRVSRKSELSPSITKGSDGIDLGKNSGIDMGRKSEPSITSGGIGITQEVANVNGLSVTGGVNVDITPLDFGISVNPSEGTISVAGGAEIPGGILGVSGGLIIDTNTGEVIGGSIGGEIGGLGINVSNSKEGGIGIEFTVQIPGTPIELILGFGFSPKKPIIISPSDKKQGIGSPASDLPDFKDNCLYYVVWFQHPPGILLTYSKPLIRLDNHPYYSEGIWGGGGEILKQESMPAGRLSPGFIKWHDYPTRPDRAGYGINANEGFAQLAGFGSQSPAEILGATQAISYPYNGAADYLYNYGAGIKEWMNYWVKDSGWEFSVIQISCVGDPPDSPPIRLTPTDKQGSSGSSSPPPPPFPNPPPRKQKKMDACCQENLAFLRLIYTRLGLAKFPGQLPNTIIQEVAEEGEEPAEPQQVRIPDLVSLLSWTFERDDERWGQWVVQINVKDSDITKEGDQGKQVKFPNLAESIAEIEGQILSLTANVDALVAITTKNLVESGLGRQEAIKSYLAAKSIIKYMAFKTTEIDVDIPACFTPEALTIHELIKESTIHFKGIDYTEKETLRDIYLDLLQAAAIIRAVHWQKIDAKKDTKLQLLELLKGNVGLANSIKNPTIPANGTGQSNSTQDFEDFLDTVEDGFRNVTGVADPENPYGKTPDRRPRIRQIGENISQAGGKS
ncbi:hypothetical protein [Microcoleus sp.]|uniref:hypothetical protein n=1 Tax=Microcoleus sp. TaxID=44472 RepID=UPI00403E56D8